MITKQEVDLIIMKVSSNGQDAINMKICRFGTGGLPQLRISAMSFMNDSRYFEPIIGRVPDEILSQPINHEEATPHGYIEYVVAFFGVSANGDTGEGAKWTKSTGVRVKLDQQSNFNHPIMYFLDGLVTDATQLTNEWYFDSIMQIVFKAKSSSLPAETILTSPRTQTEITADYQNYVGQMLQSQRRWDMSKFVENKTYEIEGKLCVGIASQNANSFDVRFIPKENPVVKPKAGWKFW